MASWPDGPILCGIDFSKDSKHAWLVAQALAQQLSRPLIVVTAIDPLLAEAGRSHYGEKFVEENASKDLSKFLGEASVAYTTVVEVGAAGDALVKAAAAQRASLIVVGTRGLGRTKRLFFGSTALRILRTSEHPVLAVPADIETPAKAAGNRFAHLVCGVDFSESSLHAARMASDLGRQISASVTIVHAVARIAVPETWDSLAVSSADTRAAEATSRLQEVTRTLGSPAPAVTVRVGDVADVIAEAASHPATLIVLGLGGRDGHRPGTHAYRILTEAKVPVMGIPARTA